MDDGITCEVITDARLSLLESFKELADCKDPEIVREGLQVLRRLDDMALELNNQTEARGTDG